MDSWTIGNHENHWKHYETLGYSIFGPMSPGSMDCWSAGVLDVIMSSLSGSLLPEAGRPCRGFGHLFGSGPAARLQGSAPGFRLGGDGAIRFHILMWMVSSGNLT